MSELIVKLTRGTDDTVKELNALCDGKTHDRKYSRNLPQSQMQGDPLCTGSCTWPNGALSDVWDESQNPLDRQGQNRIILAGAG